MDQKDKILMKYLRTLPIWDETNQLAQEIEKLKFDVDKNLDKIRENDHKLQTFPRINTDGKVVVHQLHKNIDSDIVRLYTCDDRGNCEIIPCDEVGARGDRLYQDSNVSGSLELLEKRLAPDEDAFVMLKQDEPWYPCKVRSLLHLPVNGRPSTVIKLNLRTAEGQMRVVSAKKFAVARAQRHGDKLRASKRVIAGPDDKSLRSGIIGQDPCTYNNHRYLIFFDDGNAEYHKPERVYPICYQSARPWKDFINLYGKHNPSLECELNQFFKTYPRRHLLQAKIGLKFDISRNGMIVRTRVVGIDDDVLKIFFEDNTEESIFAGSARILLRDELMSRLLKDELDLNKLHHKLVGHMERYHIAGKKAIHEEYLKFFETFDNLTICGRTARKSTARSLSSVSPPRLKIRLDDQIVPDDRQTCPDLQELLDSSDRNHKKCTPDCLDILGKRTEAHIENLEDEFRNVSDLKVPLLLGWKRILVRNQKGKQVYIYEAPCGRIINSCQQLRNYLRQTQCSQLDIDFFSFDREIVLNRAKHEMHVFYHDPNIAKDANGKPLEKKFISLVNPLNDERLPLDFEYRAETFPHPMLKAKGFSFNTEFKSGCDCEDDCNVRAACACHGLNETAAGTNAHNRGSIDTKCQYKDKRLPQQVSTGIFECNEYCNCNSKCPNRVVQNGIRVRLQLQKTASKGWGVFALDDIPKGAFVCTYSAELLDDADQYGADDMYFADLDYISVVEEGKLALEDEEKSDEGVETDSDNSQSSHSSENKRLNKKRSRSRSSSPIEFDIQDPQLAEFMPSSCRYPRRARNSAQASRVNGDRGPNRNNGENRTIYKPIFELLDETHDTYTLDARMQGNIGRFFNHSCDPNIFVQNVFIETHDLRFPVVAFFTKRHVKADEELTWNYNYKIDSIAGREIWCKCQAPNCKGRIL